jgi:hypothetical protein
LETAATSARIPKINPDFEALSLKNKRGWAFAATELLTLSVAAGASRAD